MKPANRGAREGPESSPQNPWRKQRTTHHRSWKESHWKHSMERPKRLDEAEARTKSAFRNRKTHVVCPEELHRAPTTFWRTRETTQEGWQTGQDPRTTRNYAGSVRTQENVRTRHFRTRTLRTELQSLKGRDGQPPTRRRGDTHAKRKGRCPEQRPYRYAKTRCPDLSPGRGVTQRIWGTLNIHQQPIPRSPTSGRAASKPPCVEDQPMKRPGEKNHREAAEADQSPGEGERQQGQKKKGQDPLLRWWEGYTQRPRQKRRQQNVEPTLLQSRLADQRMTQRHPRGRAGKKAPKNPTVLIPSFEIRLSDPDPTGVSPSWRNTDQISKVDFVTIEWEKTHSTRRVTPSRSN